MRQRGECRWNPRWRVGLVPIAVPHRRNPLAHPAFISLYPPGECVPRDPRASSASRLTSWRTSSPIADASPGNPRFCVISENAAPKRKETLAASPSPPPRDLSGFALFALFALWPF